MYELRSSPPHPFPRTPFLNNFRVADNPGTTPLMDTSAFVGTNVETNRLFSSLSSAVDDQFDLPGLRGSCVPSTYSVEDGPNPVI